VKVIVGHVNDGDFYKGRRNIICAMCGRITDDKKYGHFKQHCDMAAQQEHFHFCCPCGGCELYGEGVPQYRWNGGNEPPSRKKREWERQLRRYRAISDPCATGSSAD
jgi:hypothetical protein